jgi:hypothetical protein
MVDVAETETTLPMNKRASIGVWTRRKNQWNAQGNQRNQKNDQKSLPYKNRLEANTASCRFKPETVTDTTDVITTTDARAPVSNSPTLAAMVIRTILPRSKSVTSIAATLRTSVRCRRPTAGVMTINAGGSLISGLISVTSSITLVVRVMRTTLAAGPSANRNVSDRKIQSNRRNRLVIIVLFVFLKKG